MPQPVVLPAGATAFDAVLSARAIHCVYQPVVALDSRRVIGFEALARGPSRSAWHDPEALVRHAAKVGRLPELDWICRAAACRGALGANLASTMYLFVNTEPASCHTPCPADLQPMIQRAEARLTIVAEVTERGIATDPQGLLMAVEGMRRRGYRIALDDVGAVPDSQRLMPLLDPDIIKLDRRIIQQPDTSRASSVIDEVRHHCETTGAVILAEGIETLEHLATARRVGAALGQGWLLGWPARLPHTVTGTAARWPFRPTAGPQRRQPG